MIIKIYKTCISNTLWIFGYLDIFQILDKILRIILKYLNFVVPNILLIMTVFVVNQLLLLFISLTFNKVDT